MTLNFDKTFIIAEIGTSHQGDLKKAFDMIDAAGEAGADCVKFQLVFADEIIHPGTGLVDLPTGKIDLYSVFKRLEADSSFFAKLKEHTEKAGLFFLCTPFGIKSAGILRDLNVQAMKIASPELNHIPLLSEVAKYGLPVFLSTGVSTLGDIEKAVQIIPHDKTVLLHCITSYPAPEEEYNLKILKNLSAVFGLPVGVSDHSLDPVLVPVLSAVMGGCVIEKHFTLSKVDSGLDDPIALDPGQFNRMVREVRSVQSAGKNETMKRMRKEYSERKVDAILGDGIKRLAPSEKANYTYTNRSIHALCSLSPGDILTDQNCAVLRSEKILKPGLHPEFFEQILGKNVTRPVQAGQGILLDDLIFQTNSFV